MGYLMMRRLRFFYHLALLVLFIRDGWWHGRLHLTVYFLENICTERPPIELKEEVVFVVLALDFLFVTRYFMGSFLSLVVAL